MPSRNDWVAHLMRYSLPELRKRQRINRAQLCAAYKMNSERAYIELMMMCDSLTEAIMLKTDNQGNEEMEKENAQAIKELRAVLSPLIEQAVKWVVFTNNNHINTKYKNARIWVGIAGADLVWYDAGCVVSEYQAEDKRCAVKQKPENSTGILLLPKRQLVSGGLSAKTWDKLTSKVAAKLESLGRYPKRERFDIYKQMDFTA